MTARPRRIRRPKVSLRKRTDTPLYDAVKELLKFDPETPINLGGK